MVGCTVLAVSVRTYLQIGFVVGVKILVKLFDAADKTVCIIAFHFDRETKILSHFRVSLKVELHNFFLSGIDFYIPSQIGLTGGL